MKKVIIGVLLHIIIPCIIIIAVLLVLNTTDIISLDGLKPVTVLASDEKHIGEGAQGILDTAEMIAQYMLDEKNKGNGFSYPHGSLKDEVAYNQLYNVGDSRWCVCATYVSWILQDLGIWPEDRHEDGVSECWDWFESDPRFVRHERANSNGDMKENENLEEGEIIIFKSAGHSHINIYAGDGMYWDTGNDDGAMIGETKPHSLHGYTCSFTYEG